MSVEISENSIKLKLQFLCHTGYVSSPSLATWSSRLLDSTEQTGCFHHHQKVRLDCPGYPALTLTPSASLPATPRPSLFSAQKQLSECSKLVACVPWDPVEHFPDPAGVTSLQVGTVNPEIIPIVTAKSWSAPVPRPTPHQMPTLTLWSRRCHPGFTKEGVEVHTS